MLVINCQTKVDETIVFNNNILAIMLIGKVITFSFSLGADGFGKTLLCSKYKSNIVIKADNPVFCNSSNDQISLFKSGKSLNLRINPPSLLSSSSTGY